MATTYTVKEGDTLSGIAEQYGVSDYNTITGYSSGDPNVLSVGEVLTLPENQLSVSAGAANSEFATYSSDLTKALASIAPPTSTTSDVTIENVSASDPYAKMLDDLSASANASTKALIASIQASRINQQNQVTDEYDRYKAALQSLGIQHNQAFSAPEILSGHIIQAENEKMSKIQALDREEKKAIMDAEYAQQQNDLETLKAKMDRVEEIKAQKNEELKAMADQLDYEASIAEDVASAIYSSYVTLSADEKEQFLVEVAKQYKIPLATLASAMVDQQNGGSSSDSSSGDGTSTEDFGSETGTTGENPGQYKVDRGYNIPQDMIDVTNYLNENSDDPEGDIEKAQTDTEFFNYILALTP